MTFIALASRDQVDRKYNWVMQVRDMLEGADCFDLSSPPPTGLANQSNY